PTITLTPGPNSSRVRSGKDLKPLTVIDLRYISARLSRLELLQRGPCGLLLVGRVVADERPASGQPLLERRFEVDQMLERVADLGREGIHHGRRRPLVPERQEARSDHRLDHGA